METVKELDQNNEKYLEMLRQPILVDPEYPKRLDQELEKFILHIFEQPKEKAYRRSRVYYPRQHDEYLARAVDSETLTFQNLLKRILVKLTVRK